MTVDDRPTNITTAIFGELVSDPFSSTSYGTQPVPEEEGIELQDLRPAQSSAVFQDIHNDGEGSQMP